MPRRKISLHTTRGLVVRWIPYSNTSQIVHLFTRDQGLVSLLAKGALRQGRRSSSFPVPFDLAGWYDIVYRDRSGELGLATEARLIEGFDHLRRSLPAHVEACFALELMRKLVHLRPPHAGCRIWMERYSPVFRERERFPTLAEPQPRWPREKTLAEPLGARPRLT